MRMRCRDTQDRLGLFEFIHAIGSTVGAPNQISQQLMPVLLGGHSPLPGSQPEWITPFSGHWILSSCFPVSHRTFQKFFYSCLVYHPCSALLVSNPKHMALPYFHGPSYFTEFRASVCIPSTVFSISHHLPSSLSFPRLYPSSNSPILILRSPSPKHPCSPLFPSVF